MPVANADLPTPHSPRGASSAERWLNCQGSVALIDAVKVKPHYFEDDDPDWRRDGIEAHELAADCLNTDTDAWEGDEAKYPTLTAEMMKAVQVHIDYVRSRSGWKFAELKMHRPEFHDLMYGTTDVAVLDPDNLEIIDYKHGVGIVVEVEENPQMMYYAFMVIDELGKAWANDAPITLTIVQPRVSWRDPIRSWTTTVGFIRAWAIETLLPVMSQAYADGFLSPGEHCRFCPAKLLCPAMLSIGAGVAKLTVDEIKAMSDPVLSDLLHKAPLIRMLLKELNAEAYRRMVLAKGKLPGWKVVAAIVDRIWKPEAPVAAKYGYQPPKLKSPAMVEAEGGKEFVAEWAFKPDGGFNIVPENDRRKAIPMDGGVEKWQKVVDNLKKVD